MDNFRIAGFFRDIASLLELKEENRFRIMSDRRAAETIGNYPEQLENVYNKGGLKALEAIENIGHHSALRIEELLKTGKLKYLDSLLKEYPAGLLEIMKIQGLGPRLASTLFRKLNVRNINDLIRAAKSGRLLELPGIRDKKVENIIKGINSFTKMSSEHYIGEVLPYAEDIASSLKKSGNAGNVLVCGSLRRMKETVGDIDILVTSSSPAKIMDGFIKLPQVKSVTARGRTKASVKLGNGMDADLRVVDGACFGSASHYFTGSKQHNIRIRALAAKKGLKVSEYGVFKGKKMIAGKSEQEVFESLGLPYLPPEIREDSGEFEAALKGRLPRLVRQEDIRGDLHVHSDYSDGNDPIEKIALHAQKMGYRFIAITDHSKSTRIAEGLTEKELVRQIKEIDKINKRLKGFRILKGSEVDILPDGSLDFSDDILAQLDIVIASVHSRFNMPRQEMTLRVIEAMKNKYVTFIGHPTGRLLGVRDPYDIDMEKVVEAASRSNKALELNSHPHRLDLNAIHCRLAKEKGVKIAVGTDSHDVKELLNIRFGMGTARRGWLEKEDLLNCSENLY